ncbi:hypothetical protein [Streptomyces albidoflavus]|uniref:hypothetical protein n=1 Tax=Streptomyces albidoflavus TaxID=1886 RepID=UPI0005241D52|nr:hypothetical protein [Streptomyces albidoflavus]
MGAALHLAHVTELPTRKQKRKGGGSGGDDYDKLVTRVYQDPRMTPEARELILLVAWLAARDPNRFDEQGNPRKWRKRASDILGEYGQPNGRRESRLADLLYADRPRYDFPRLSWTAVCAAPMIRRAGPCGQPANSHDYEVNRETGWKTPVYFCRRHEQWGRQLHQRRAQEPGPEPIPNAGGLLPSYFAGTDSQAAERVKAWARLYKEAAVWKRDRLWEPPKAYGLCADDWPVPGQDPIPQRARLRLVLGDA